VRVVIDTNAFISTVLFEGPTSALLTLWQTHKIRILVSIPAWLIRHILRLILAGHIGVATTSQQPDSSTFAVFYHPPLFLST
jgi:predicted nucleic acid-binding protein